MAKVITKRKRLNPKITKFLLAFFVFSITTSLFTSLFIRTYNQKLTMEIQNSEYKTKQIYNENEVLKIEIQNLVSQERVFEVALNSEMEINQDNVVSINR